MTGAECRGQAHIEFAPLAGGPVCVPLQQVRARYLGRRRGPVHHAQRGISRLDEGQRVEYELQPGRDGKSSAENLKLIE